LLCQLGITAAIVAASFYSEALGGIREVKDDDGTITTEAEDGLVQKIWIPSAISAVLSILALYFVRVPEEGKTVGRPLQVVVPANYIVGLIFTVSMSMVVSKLSIAAETSNPGIVFEAVALTTAAVLGITIFAFTKFSSVEGAGELSIIAPLLSAAATVFGVAALFVFGP
jgi:hypothetical protein